MFLLINAGWGHVADAKQSGLSEHSYNNMPREAVLPIIALPVLFHSGSPRCGLGSKVH